MKKINLFLGACLPVRLLIVYLAYFIGNKKEKLKPLAYIFSIFVGLGFIYQSIYGKKVGAFGSNVYWPRQLHGVLYLLFALVLSVSPKHAWLILLLDILIGLFVVLN